MKINRILISLAYLPIIGICIWFTFDRTIMPKEPPYQVQGMSTLKDVEPDAVIWSWWDHGYPMQYFTGKATISDGGYHSGRQCWLTAYPFFTDSEKRMTDFMKAHVGERPLYLYFNWKNLLSIDSMYMAGSWDIKERKINRCFFQMFPGAKIKDGKMIAQSSVVNTEKGELYLSGEGRRIAVPLAGLYVVGKKIAYYPYNREGKLYFILRQRDKLGILISRNILESIFVKLYLFETYDKRYLEPVKIRTPYYQIWRVKHHDTNN